MPTRRTYPFLAVLLGGMAPAVAPAQPADCQPPAIDSVITNNPLCPGDSVHLAVVASGDILGYSWEGPGTGTFFTVAPQYSFGLQVLGQYTIVAYGACGIDTAVVAMSAEGAGAGGNDTIQVCDDDAPRVLGLYLGPHAEGGWWTFNGQAHAGVYDPALDVPGDYIYSPPQTATCPGSTQSAVITVGEIHVGRDTTWSVCQTDPAFALAAALSASADPNGDWAQWQFLSWVPHGASYDPAVDSSATFRYAIGTCYATVQVLEQPASAWYEDADGDGFGDPAHVAWACAQPEGYVADSSDNCSGLPGRVGSPCDDGLPQTVNDAVTDSCTCAGTLASGIAALAREPAFALWPNPGDGRALFVQAMANGPGLLRVYDQLGRLHGDYAVQFNGSAVEVAFGRPLGKGLYWLRLDLDGRSAAKPFVVR